MNKNDTIFDKMLRGEVKCDIVYEDEYILSFHDIAPQAPVHVLIIPKKKIVNIAAAQETDIDILGKILYSAKKIAEKMNISQSGYRLIFNNKQDAGQTVDYLHCHLLGGRVLGWPPG